jgi:quercetin dioxygenase-like cupin family protein
MKTDPPPTPPQIRDDRVTRGPEERALDKPIQQLDLATEAEVLRHEEGWRKVGHSAKTLVKHDLFRIVLIALKQGSRMKEHQAEGVVSIHTLTGRIRLDVEGQPVELSAGSLLALERGVSHDVEALADSTLLLSVCIEPS